MRVWGTVIILVVAILVLNALSGAFLVQQVDESLAILDGVNKAVQQEDWESALAQQAKLQDKWDVRKPWLDTLLEHSETDEINAMLARIQNGLSLQNTDDVSGDIAELRVVFEHIPIIFKVSLENIF